MTIKDLQLTLQEDGTVQSAVWQYNGRTCYTNSKGSGIFVETTPGSNSQCTGTSQFSILGTSPSAARQRINRWYGDE